MIALLAAACTYVFSAYATGLEKDAPVEFLFASKNSDRDYESMFLIEESVEDFCKGIEKAGLPKGSAVDLPKCILWPTGCTLTIEPSISEFIETHMPEGYSMSDIIYTGGARDEKGALMPESMNAHCGIFALYSLSHSPIVFNGIFPQGDVYGAHSAKKALKKGEKVTFRLTWDGKTKPKNVTVNFKPGNSQSELLKLKAISSENREINVKATFSPDMSFKEARAISSALSAIDSKSVKINGVDADGLFYRAFLPLVKWTDRAERLLQPFELTITNGVEELVYIAEDWSGESLNPKLTPKTISFEDAKKYPKVTSCFIYTKSEEKLSTIYQAKKKLSGTKVQNWYVFEKN